MSFDYKPIGYGAIVFSGFAFKSSDLTDNGIPVIKIGNIKNKIIDYTSTQFFPEAKVTEKHSKFFLEDKDVLIAMTGQGSVGRVGRIRLSIDKKILLNQRVGKFITDNTNLDNEFLFYVISSSQYAEILFNAGTGSGQPNLSPKTILSVEIPYPQISEQKAIAATLSSLDDKIELNNQINKNLEEMAQVIFKSWFVDFEPFQDGEFEDSELGRIPKGWKVGTISDLGNVIGGSTPSKAHAEYYTDKGIAWITPKDLSNNKDKFISKGEIDITELGLKNSSTKIMPKGTVLFSSRAPIGYIAIAKNELTTNQGFKSVVPKDNIGTAYVYFFFKDNLSLIESRASGSTFKEVSGSIMKQIPALIPDDKVLTKFQDICNTYFEHQMLLENQNQTLIKMRDALLPRLMSGEIRVPIEEVQ